MRISDWSSDVCSSDLISNFDVLLAERVLGATGAGRRSTTIEWDNIDRLTSWRFGMATATAGEEGFGLAMAGNDLLVADKGDTAALFGNDSVAGEALLGFAGTAPANNAATATQGDAGIALALTCKIGR